MKRFFSEKVNLLIISRLQKPKFNSVTGSATGGCCAFFCLNGTLNAENRTSVTVQQLFSFSKIKRNSLTKNLSSLKKVYIYINYVTDRRFLVWFLFENVEMLLHCYAWLKTGVTN